MYFKRRHDLRFPHARFEVSCLEVYRISGYLNDQLAEEAFLSFNPGEMRYPWVRLACFSVILKPLIKPFWAFSIEESPGIFLRPRFCWGSSFFPIRFVHPPSPPAAVCEGRATEGMNRSGANLRASDVDSTPCSRRENHFISLGSLTLKTGLFRPEQGSSQFPWMLCRPKHRRQPYPGQIKCKNNF